MRIKYRIRNRNTKYADTCIEMTIQDAIVIEKIKDLLASPKECDMETEFEFHDITIEQG